MLIPLEQLVSRHGIKRSAALHVGGHVGEEAAWYANLGFAPVWWIEANPRLLSGLRGRVSQFPQQIVVGAAVSDKVKPVTLHVANNGASSSYYPLGTHATEHPDVVYIDEIKMDTTTIDILWEEGKIGQAEYMSLDIQGAELDALCGSEAYLGGVNAVYCEVNEKEVYEGCALLPELALWLSERGFQMVDLVMLKHGWGDALFVRNG